MSEDSFFKKAMTSKLEVYAVCVHMCLWVHLNVDKKLCFRITGHPGGHTLSLCLFLMPWPVFSTGNSRAE